MMVMIGAVTLIGVLGVLELVVLLGVVRKLKEHGSALAATRPAPYAAMQPGLRPGQAVGEFDARTLEGEPLGRSDLADGTEVGFFSPTCAPCWSKIPEFVRRARSSGQRPLAVVVLTGAENGAARDLEQSSAEWINSDPDAQRMVERLRAAGTVVPDRLGGPLPTAFGVFGFPVSMTVARDEAGRLVVAGG